MKICVFSTPRTCSSMMCYVLANRFDLYNFGEIMYGTFHARGEKKSEKIKFFKESDNYVIKLFSRYFYEEYLDLSFFDTFDYIFMTERKNLVDQMASLYKMLNENKNHIDVLDKNVIEFFERHKTYIQHFYDIKKFLLEKYTNTFVIDYEYLSNHSVDMLNTITNMTFTDNHFYSLQNRRTNINYSKYFDNYTDLANIVDSWEFVK